MILLPLLDVVFVNLVGADPGHVQKQLAMVLEDNRAVARKVAPADAAALARHDERATEIVKDMNVDGLVSSAIVTAGGHKTLRITIYDADGNMRSMSETPLTGKTLAAGDVDVLHDNLGDEVGHLIAKAEKLAAKEGAQARSRRSRPRTSRCPTAAPSTSPSRRRRAEPKLRAGRGAGPDEEDRRARRARHGHRRRRAQDARGPRQSTPPTSAPTRSMAQTGDFAEHRRDHDRVVGGCGPRARAPHRGGRRRRHAVAQLHARPDDESRRTARRPSAWCTSRRAPSQSARPRDRRCVRSLARDEHDTDLATEDRADEHLRAGR